MDDTVNTHDRHDEIDPEEAVELRRQLEEIRIELESISRDRMRWPEGAPLHLQDRSEELETKADAIRARLGMPPATGRPPKGSWWGWPALIGVTAAILAGVLLFTR